MSMDVDRIQCKNGDGWLKLDGEISHVYQLISQSVRPLDLAYSILDRPGGSNQNPALHQHFTRLNLGVTNPASSSSGVHGHSEHDNPNSSLPQPCTSFAMAPRKKRKMTSADEDAKMKRTRSSSKHYSSSSTPIESPAAFSIKRCQAWFNEYSEEDKLLGPEGMEKFCEDIGVEPENIVMLVVAWKLEAESMGFFTLDEWMKGMTKLQADSPRKVQGKLEFMRSLLNDPPTFKKIYRYAFDFARDKDQRSMDIETAKSMLLLLLGRQWELFGSFHHFIEHSKYKVINKDQWCNILEFSRAIHPDLHNYDEDGAWPVMLDEFVEWFRSRQQNLQQQGQCSTMPC